MENQKNILFIRLRLLGDIIFTIPAIQIYRDHFPGSRIYYVVEEKFREIASLIPGIFKVIVIPRKMGLKAMWSFRKEIKKIAFDSVVDFHSGPKSAQLTFISGIKTRIGYRTPNRNWAYTHLTPRIIGQMIGQTFSHSVFNQVKLLAHLGIHVESNNLPPYPPIPIEQSQISAALQTILDSNSGTKSVVIHVGAGNAFRDWGIDKFSALIERLQADKVLVYLVGNGEAEQKTGAYLAGRFVAVDCTGKISIPELLHLIAHASVYVGADSGPLHLASLTATPLIAIYGPNVPEISGPWRTKNVTILQKEMACRPCNQKKCIYGIIPCMKNITMDDVYEAINRYIK